ncbi:MAG: hypothetical protein K940chlam5_00322 [Candidatus Anoxychlamydiales bacterium]|nr:hypothetical protein [Candidatus Anoxychlamydiales bacterium]
MSYISSIKNYLSPYNPFKGPSDSKFKNLTINISEPISAGLAIMPTVYGFIAKSALQIGKKIPKITLRTPAKFPQSISTVQLGLEGIKASPKLGAAVGAQMIGQEKCQAYLENSRFFNNPQKKVNLSSMFLSSGIIGVISSPFLIAFNDQTIGNSFFKSLRALTPSKVVATAARETGFVFSLGFSKPLAKKMKEYNDSKTTEKAAYFVSGYAGSIVSHPCDTILTLLQKGIKLPSFFSPLNKQTIQRAASVMYRGANVRASTIGVFSILYNSLNKFINREETK